MNLKMLLSVYAVLTAVNGAAYLVDPSALMSLIGVAPLDFLEIMLMRGIGTMAIGLAVMCWAARAAEASKARDALILGLIVMNGLGAVVAVLTGIAAEGRLVGGPWLVGASAAFQALFMVLFIVAGRRARSAP